MGVVPRALRILLPFIIGTTLLLLLLLFGIAYGFEMRSLSLPSDTNPSIAVDLSGALHISHSVSYRGYNSDQGLYHTSNSSGEWSTVRIVSNESVDSTSIAVDARGHLHIAYTYDLDLSTSMPPGNVEGFVGYATDSSGEWRTYVVSSGYGMFRHCSLDLTPDGVPGILYFIGGNAFFATTINGTEKVFATEPTGVSALNGDIAFDGNSVAHVIFVSNGSLCLAARSSPGVWSSSSIFDGQVSSARPVLTYGNGSYARVAFFADAGGKGLFYGETLEGPWSVTRVSNVTETAPAFCSLFISQDGTPHISSSSGTVLAMYSELVGDHWINRHLAGVVGASASPTEIAVSASGNVYLSFGSGWGQIEYFTDDATPVDVMSQVPYLLPLAVTLMLISGVFALLEVARILRKGSAERNQSTRWPPGGT